MTQNADSSTLHVLMMPDYRPDNPYQSLLSEGLLAEGVESSFPTGYRRVFPIFRAITSSPTKIDVLHLHWLDPYTKSNHRITKLIYTIKFLIDILLTRLAGVKVVWTIHNRIPHNSKFPKLDRWTRCMLSKLVDRIIVHHPSALEELAQTYQFNPTKATVIPHGHYRQVYGNLSNSLEAREKLGLPLSGRIYLNLGMLKPYKGIERLLEVWQKNHELFAEDTLLIAGQALIEEYGLKLSQQVAQTKNAILHLGFVDDNQIPLYFSATDVIVLPFESILTSGSLILAMSFNKPIIAPCVPGILETLGAANHLLYDSNDPQGLLYALKESTQIDLKQLGEIVKHECDQLDWRAIGQKMFQVYQNS
ncbi:glycosyltransferase [Oculatella sp. LEGE 06141]|uniref:glycosyltransferase n=1 Tax=Oculatella sp. LEGE 06141 TaxID=1828648 RepID=UPI00187E24F5|nr:glycosyltransferase [Oculatella sp. LEGE 06141]MBE9179517.1 glycosyltransferase [Oculatella sp. LEGE 06141]